MTCHFFLMRFFGHIPDIRQFFKAVETFHNSGALMGKFDLFGRCETSDFHIFGHNFVLDIVRFRVAPALDTWK